MSSKTEPQNERQNRRNTLQLQDAMNQAKLAVENATFDIFDQFSKQRQESEASFKIGAKEYARVRIVDRPTRRLESMIGLREELLDLSEELQVKLKGILEKYIEERYD